MRCVQRCSGPYPFILNLSSHTPPPLINYATSKGTVSSEQGRTLRMNPQHIPLHHRYRDGDYAEAELNVSRIVKGQYNFAGYCGRRRNSPSDPWITASTLARDLKVETGRAKPNQFAGGPSGLDWWRVGTADTCHEQGSQCHCRSINKEYGHLIRLRT